MKPLSLLLVVFGALFAQVLPNPPAPAPAPGMPSDVRLPNGKLQRDEIAKADYKKNLEDATEMARLAEEVKSDLEKETAYVVSVKTMKKTEDIEKLARNIRGRLKRY